MDREKLMEARQWVRGELDKCVEFWLINGMDSEHGGVYTCLDRTGKRFSTDKSVWMQAAAHGRLLICVRFTASRKSG